MKKARLFLATLSMSAIMCITAMAGEWKQDQTGWWYQNDDGSYQTNQWFQDFDGTWYYLNESGYMLTNGTAPDGRQIGADGKWIEPIKGEFKAVLKEVNNWIIGDVWNHGYCDFTSYEYDGKDSTGSTIDIEYAYQIFVEKYKKKAGYNAFINSLSDDYSSLKTAWNKLSSESDKLYQYYEKNGIKITGNPQDTALFVQYREVFTDYAREAWKK